MNEYQVIVLATRFSQSVDAVADRLLAIGTARKYPLQLVDGELVGIRLQNRLPPSQTNHRNAVNVRMLLECLQCVDDNGAVVDMHKLLGNVLPHTVAGTSGNNQRIVH